MHVQRRNLDVGDTNKGKHGGHKAKLITEAHCAFLRELMDEDCTVTLEYMQEQLEAVDGLHVSFSTIHNRVAGFHYSFKVVKKQCFAAITDAVKEQRREYSRWLINAVMLRLLPSALETSPASAPSIELA